MKFNSISAAILKPNILSPSPVSYSLLLVAWAMPGNSSSNAARKTSSTRFAKIKVISSWWKAKIHLIKICLCKTYVKKDHNKREKRRRDSIVLIKSLPGIFQQRMYSTVLRMYSTWHNDKYWLTCNDEWVTTNELVLRSSHLPGTTSRVTLEKNLVVNRELFDDLSKWKRWQISTSYLHIIW